MDTVNTAEINKIKQLLNTGTANTILLKDKIVDLFVAANPEVRELNFDKGVDWPEDMFTVQSIPVLAYQKSIEFNGKEVKFYNIELEATCKLQGWVRSHLQGSYEISFKAAGIISVHGNHIAFREIDEIKTL